MSCVSALTRKSTRAMPVQPSVLYTRTPRSFIFFVIWSPIFAGTSLYCAFTPALPFPPFFPPDKYLSLKSKNSVLLSGPRFIVDHDGKRYFEQGFDAFFD